MEIDLAELIDSLPGLIWTALTNGDIDHVGKRWIEQTGLSVDESVGMGWTAAIHPDDAKQLLEIWAAVRASGEIGEGEARLRRPDGDYRWYLFRASPIRAPSGEVLRWCGANFDIDDRIRAEESAREHRRRYEEVLDGLPGNVSLFTAEGNIAFANRRMLAYFDESLQQLQARPAAELIHREDRERIQAIWAVAVPSGEPFEFESRLRRSDGAYRWHSTGLFPLRNSSGEIELWYALSTDIDDTKRAQAQLAAEKRLLELVALGVELPNVLDALCKEVEELAPDSYCSIFLANTFDGRFHTGAGPSLPPDLLKMCEGAKIDPRYGPASVAVTQKAAVIVSDIANDPRWPDSWWPKQMAKIGFRSCWTTPVLSGDQEVLGTFTIHRRESQSPGASEQELTDRFTKIAGIAIERAQAEAALKASQEETHRINARLTKAEGVSKTGSFTWDWFVDETDGSDEVYRFFGFEPGSRITMARISALIHPDDLPAVEAVRVQAAEGHEFDVRFRIVTASDEVRHGHVVAHPSEQVTADRRVFIGALQDITEARVAEEALNRARAELAHVARLATMSALTASIAHEVNQPLAGIMTNASTCLRMLASERPNLEGARATAERTIRDANRASEVIRRLRAMFVRKRPGAESVDLNNAAREVLVLSAGELQTGRVVLRTDFAENLPAIHGDRIQLQQVILNLVLNAADAMRKVDGRPRTLEITTSFGPTSEVVLSVRDEGVGFNAKDHERLFDPFYTTKNEGMGVGLSISRSIIEGHRGRLWAIPNDAGHGATFCFAIPCDAQEGPSEPNLGRLRAIRMPPTKPALRKSDEDA